MKNVFHNYYISVAQKDAKFRMIVQKRNTYDKRIHHSIRAEQYPWDIILRLSQKFRYQS